MNAYNYEFDNDKTYVFVSLGHRLRISGKDLNSDRNIVRDTKGRFVSGKKLKCPKCKKRATKDDHDPCISNLPGVKYACCGHGIEEGYISFENGVVIRGNFEVDKR